MSQELDDLKAAVTDEETVIGGATTLLKTLADKVEATAGDKAAAIALAAQIRTDTAALSDAVVANTPAEPAVS